VGSGRKRGEREKRRTRYGPPILGRLTMGILQCSEMGIGEELEG